MIDVSRLKKLTADAIQRGKEEAIAQEEARKKAAERRRLEDERKAQSIIDKIPERAEKAAGKGDSHLIVIRKTDSNYGDNHTLQGVDKIVYDYCLAAGLNPSVDYWHDGAGLEAGWSLTIHW